MSSGIKSVILYRVTGANKEVINTSSTKKIFASSDTHSAFDMYYEITADEKRVSYYEIIVTDFAGNSVKKKLTSQYSLLSWFHTSIDTANHLLYYANNCICFYDTAYNVNKQGNLF